MPWNREGFLFNVDLKHFFLILAQKDFLNLLLPSSLPNTECLILFCIKQNTLAFLKRVVVLIFYLSTCEFL